MFGSGWDAGLDEAQMAAVLHGDGPLVVLAGAGTGKTRTLTARVARLLEGGTTPERILLLTFTRRAAEDMLSRAADLAGGGGRSRRICGGTFHSVAHRIVSAFAEPLGLPAGMSVLDPADAADTMDLLRDEHGLSGRGERSPRPATLVDIYSRCVNTKRRLNEVLAIDFPWCEPHEERIARIFRSYVAKKRSCGQLDFDDLLLYWRAALADDGLGAHLRGSFDHVLVDEYQDVNAVQVEIVRLLCPDGHGLTVVGDDAQAIYGFRGSDACYLQDLAASLPTSSTVRLDRNFRSFQPILAVANAVRPSGTAGPLLLSSHRPGGQRPVLVRCYDTAAEARAIVDRVLAAHEQGRPLRDQAVLVRAAHHSDLVELELTARKVPYRKYGGLRFVEAAHVKDFVAATRLIGNQSDELAWLRLLRLHPGVGPAKGRELLATLPAQAGDAAHDWAETVAAAPARARVQMAATFDALSRARDAVGCAAKSEGILTIVRPLVAARYTNVAARAADLERLASAAAASDDLAAWAAEVTLDPPASSGDYAGPPHVDEDYVVVSTVHSAKGLEWPVVHLPHLVDGAFPSDMALRSPSGVTEERRLLYVAVTRARDELYLYTPLRMPHHPRALDDRHSLAPASRFLDDDVLPALDVVEERRERRPIAAAVDLAPVTVELDELWS